MEPITTYTERLIQVRRQFVLYRDRVQINAFWLLRGRFQSSVPLASLKAEYTTLNIRNKLFRPGMFIIAVGMALLIFAGDVTKLREMQPWPMTGVMVTGVGLALVWLTRRPVRFVRFPLRDGKGAGLDIGRAGTDKKNFDSFVAAVQKQIRRA